MINAAKWMQHANDFWRQPRLLVALSAEQRYLKIPGIVRISTVSLLRIFKLVWFFFEIPPWNLLTIALAQPYFLPFFFHGCSLELEERCLLRRGGGYEGSRGPSTFSGTFALALALSDCFTFGSGSSSLSETSTHCKAVPRVELSPMVQPAGALPVPVGLDCSHAKSAGDTNTPACKARARRHINMM